MTISKKAHIVKTLFVMLKGVWLFLARLFFERMKMRHEIIFIDESTLTTEEMAVEMGMTDEKFENHVMQLVETENDNEYETEKQE